MTPTEFMHAREALDVALRIVQREHREAPSEVVRTVEERLAEAALGLLHLDPNRPKPRRQRA